jgi:hypothetical protein
MRILMMAAALVAFFSSAALAACAAKAGEKAKIAEKIAGGHAFNKHKAEFASGVTKSGKAYSAKAVATKADLQSVVHGIIKKEGSGFEIVCKPSEKKTRQAWYDPDQNIVVIYNKLAADCGTAFRPDKDAAKYIEEKGCGY